jgi:hypothetical protein
MKIVSALIFLASALFIHSCSSTPETPARSQQFIADSTLIAQYEKHIDSLCDMLPSYDELEKIKCPEGCFDDLKLFDEKRPFLIFQPAELNRDTSVMSYFRFDRIQGTAGRDWTPYFDWTPDLRWDSDYALYAEKFRNLIGWKYFCVFYNDTAKYVEPESNEEEETFIPGRMSGYAVIVDFNARKIVCAFKVSAESSDEVTYEGISYDGSKPAGFGQGTGVRVDLWLNLAKEVESKLYNSKTAVKNDPSNIIHDPIN